MRRRLPTRARWRLAMIQAGRRRPHARRRMPRAALLKASGLAMMWPLALEAFSLTGRHFPALPSRGDAGRSPAPGRVNEDLPGRARGARHGRPSARYPRRRERPRHGEVHGVPRATGDLGSRDRRRSGQRRARLGSALLVLRRAGRRDGRAAVRILTRPEMAQSRSGLSARADRHPHARSAGSTFAEAWSGHATHEVGGLPVPFLGRAELGAQQARDARRSPGRPRGPRRDRRTLSQTLRDAADERLVVRVAPQRRINGSTARITIQGSRCSAAGQELERAVRLAQREMDGRRLVG